jgi:EAL domain-containing protein (putative c-di-GMP-specific phosphodiesterase class I)
MDGLLKRGTARRLAEGIRMGAQAVRLSNVDIDNALKNKDFEVLFQPIFDLGNGALARMEAFVRWRHPALGVLPPGAFISFFESQGRMSELTRYVLAAALTAYTQWRGASAPGFSINLALSDLSDEAFSSHFVKLLRDHQFPADLVTLECPMPTVDTDIDTAAAQFIRLSSTGARLAIEVRGRANDLLRNIDPFPFDEIKTGGSSILRFARTVRGPGLSAISDLLEIANSANAVITAVGVEDQASLAALRGLGFTAAQGNHLGKVGGIEDFLPGRVNDVRQLLGLDSLSSDNLTALFRTEAPTPKVNELETLDVVEQTPPDALIDRLNQRVAKQMAPEEQDGAAPTTAPETAEPNEDEERKAKARIKAKALALAKRAKAREARKAAAIARAKAKSAAATQDQATTASNEAQPPPSAGPAPRELQQRLSEEFAREPTAVQSKTPDAQPVTTDAEEAAPPETVDAKLSTPPTIDHTKKLSVPEKLAAAAEATLSTSSAPQAALLPNGAPKKNDSMKQVSLSVGGVPAYFQPGIRVGGPAFDQHIQTSATREAAAHSGMPSDLTAPEDKASSLLDMPVTQAEPAISQETQEIPHPEASSPEEDIYVPPVINGDLHEKTEPLPVVRRKPVRKSFLTRTVLPYPTHFWPKSWSRRYRRWTTKRAANDTATINETPENSVQAAE